VLVPFASGWRPVAVAWGVISLWVILAVEVTSLLMKRMPRRAWHAVHLSSYALFAAATAHAITAGTDVRNPFFVIACSGALAVVLLLTLVRVLASNTREPHVAAGQPSTADRVEALRARRSPRSDAA
jgi:hypothetical protein